MNMHVLDAGLPAAGLVGTKPPGRPLPERLRDAIGLFKRQAAITALLGVLAAVAIALFWGQMR